MVREFESGKLRKNDADQDSSNSRSIDDDTCSRENKEVTTYEATAAETTA